MASAPGVVEELMLPVMSEMLQGEAAEPSTTTGAPLAGLASCAAEFGHVPAGHRHVPPFGFAGQLAAAACCSSDWSCVAVSVLLDVPLFVWTLPGGLIWPLLAE